MFHSRTRLLYPKKHSNPEFHLAQGAILAGVAFDYEEGMVLTYNQHAGTLCWLDISSGDMVRSAIAPLPNNNYVVDFCHFENIIYMLVYTDVGHMSIFTGNLQIGRDTGFIEFDEYPMPYYTPPSTHVWGLTHAPTPEYVRYHPRYCSITNCGHELFVLLGTSEDVAGIAPATLGQYVVHYDLSGLFKNVHKVDESSWVGATTGLPARAIRPDPLSNNYNGLHLAIDYREGSLLFFTENAGYNAGAIREAFYTGIELENPPARTSSFLIGPFTEFNSMCSAGKYSFYLVNNRIFRADVMAFELQDVVTPGLYSQTIDLGYIVAGMSLSKPVRLVNTSLRMIYKNLIIESRDPNMQVAHFIPLTPAEIVAGVTRPHIPDTFYRAIKWPEPVKPNDAIEFWVRVVGPQVANNRNPHYYYDYLTVKAEGEW